MSIPIIGQPKAHDWSFQIIIECVCGKMLLWMGKPAWAGGNGAIVACGCGKMYTLLAMPERDQVTGDLNLSLAMKEIPR